MFSPWKPEGGAAGFRLNAPSATVSRVFIDGAPIDAPFDFTASEPFLIGPDGEVVVFADGAAFSLSLRPRADRAEAAAVTDGVVRAPMPGRIVSMAVTLGQRVAGGQTLAVLEAMKMEHALVAPFEGKVAEVAAAEGDQVSEGVALVRLEPED